MIYILFAKIIILEDIKAEKKGFYVNRRGRTNQNCYTPPRRKKGSSVKCLETFRVTLMEEAILSLNKSTVKTVLTVFFIHPTRQKPSHINASKIYR